MQSFIFIDAVSLSDVLHQRMGERGRRLVEEKYTWDAVVKALGKGYEANLK
jgi:glycosyltransferase involved in cell wall biosynthesis